MNQRSRSRRQIHECSHGGFPLTSSRYRFEQVERPVEPLAPRYPPEEAQRGARALQLRPVEGVDVDAVPYDELPCGAPAEALSCREHDVVGDEHHHVDGVDVHQARHVVLDLEAMQTDHEPLARPFVVAVPNRVRLTPFAHDDVRPLREQSAFGFVVIAGAGAGPAILSYLHAGLGREVGVDVLEELEVVRRDDDAACLGHQGIWAIREPRTAGRLRATNAERSPRRPAILVRQRARAGRRPVPLRRSSRARRCRRRRTARAG